VRKWYREDTEERRSKRERIRRKVAKLRAAHGVIRDAGWRYLEGELVVVVGELKQTSLGNGPLIQSSPRNDISRSNGCDVEHHGGIVAGAASDRLPSRRRNRDGLATGTTLGLSKEQAERNESSRGESTLAQAVPPVTRVRSMSM